MVFTDSIDKVKGIGGKRAVLLAAASISTVEDIISRVPYSYEDSTEILSPSQVLERARKLPLWEAIRWRSAVRGRLEKVSIIRTRRGLAIVSATFVDESGTDKIRAVWFNQAYVYSALQEGSLYVLYGKIKREGSTAVYQSPKFEQIVDGRSLKLLGRITPLYRRIKTISSAYFSNFISEILQQVDVNEYLSKAELTSLNCVPLDQAYCNVHAPRDVAEIHSGMKRLAVQELLELRASYEAKFTTKQPVKNKEATIVSNRLAQHIGEWKGKLPFSLTKGQEEVLLAMIHKIATGVPLDTLIYGDVGSGKTILVFLLMFAFAFEGKDSLFVVPTTILSAQHVSNAKKLIDKLELGNVVDIVEVKAGRAVGEERGRGTVYIGTQAILHNKSIRTSDKVALVCIDEQHRFGVEQRQILLQQGRHIVTLSATPIPRTLALSFMQFSDALFLDEKPVGRKQIITKIVPADKEEVTYEWIREKISGGERAYIVFPRIEAEEENEKQSLLSMAEELKQRFYKDIPTGLLYGGMKEEDKKLTMERFANGPLTLLFCTSVIEVGVDIPEATVILIHGAEMFGLAQLHQLRGRVGRSDRQGYCLLQTSSTTEQVVTRLEYFSSHLMGREVAEYDLTDRGAGKLLGLQQSGISELKIASLSNLSLVAQTMELYEKLKVAGTSIPRYISVKSPHDE